MAYCAHRTRTRCIAIAALAILAAACQLLPADLRAAPAFDLHDSFADGGLCCVIAPSGGFEHRYPVDCWRYYPDGFKALARWARLEVLEAWTEWEPAEYGDGSEPWKDTIMVCRKPKLTGMAALRRRATDYFLLKTLRDAMKRHRGVLVPKA